MSVHASIVITCHTELRWPLTVACIASALSQSAPASEVVVSVDNNRLLHDRLAGQFPDVKVVSNVGARGASATRNVGAFASRRDCDVLVFLDDDARATAHWLARLLRPFSSPDVVGVGGGVEPEWEVGKPFWFPDEFGWVVGANYTGLPTMQSQVRNVWGENMAVRRNAFAAVGGFREGFGKVGNKSRPEDTDLCIRLARESGGRWIFVPDAIVVHRVARKRSSLRFFIGRCFSEGRGKVEMRRLLGKQHGFDHEMTYVARVLRDGLLTEARHCVTSRSLRPLARSGTILAGLSAAAIGGAAAMVGSVRRQSLQQ
jgi:glucosyl-dolichyl phosphate glucuronosyltransferase